jgi:hypothetical protein
MKLRAVVERAIVILAYVAILACQGQGQAEQKSSAIRGGAARSPTSRPPVGLFHSLSTRTASRPNSGCSLRRSPP